MTRFLAGLLLLLMTSVPAMARSHARVVFGFGFFGPPAYYYYGPPVYYAPPAYYYPPAVYYAPPPALVVRPTCIQYHGDAIIDASGQPFYGTACLQADGRWHIVN